ncbi:MAG TPA: peptidylprolyl isomerase [Candidatus Acidoferrales bacterium]
MKRITACLTFCFIAAIFPAAISAQTGTATPAAKTPVHHAAAAHTDPALMHPAMLKAKAPDEYEVTFKTTAGDFVVKVERAWAPIGADRFYNLVKHGFYNDAAFFRVVPGFVVQFGLSANPAVNAAWEKAYIQDDPVTQSNHTGFLTFATAGPNTRTTQMFISLGENARLDSMGFAAFGQVTTGMDAVQKIFSGYGESPDQGQITAEGKPYLDKSFPKLDHIISATVTSPAPAVPVHHTNTAPTPPHKAAAASTPQ